MNISGCLNPPGNLSGRGFFSTIVSILIFMSLQTTFCCYLRYISSERQKMNNQIENLIYLIRGERVMLDHDLAELYQVETKALIQAVQRNRSRFPDDFMFQLSFQEFTALRSQIVTAKLTMRRSNPYAFSEHGVAMLSSVLRSERAVEINIQIVRAFVKLRQLVASNAGLLDRLNTLEQKYDSQFRVVFDAIRRLMSDSEIPAKRRIGF